MASSFQISGPAASLTGVTGDDCSQDYVLVYSAAASPTAVGTNRYGVIHYHYHYLIMIIIMIIIIRWDKMCGAYWGVSGNPGITVYSTKLPFQLLVNFDGTEVESFSRYIYRSIYIIYYLYFYFRWNPPQQPPKTLLASTCTTNRLPADENRRMESQ